MKHGVDLLSNARFNKGSAFTVEEREKYSLTGLLPPTVSNMEQQLARVNQNLARKSNDIERYIFLASLQKRNERLYYRALIDNIDTLMPIVYTPTVGQACQEFADIFRDSQGCYVSVNHQGKIDQVLANWPEKNVKLIVVTDGERILGLGDLGTNGMGIPIGKLALYCACAGIKPEHCLPITLDVGTENIELLNNPLYMGKKQPRLRGAAYDDFLEEFMTAVTKRFPDVLLQFEDFATPNAIKLLDKYRNRLLCFNDDIQGTAAVALAGLCASTRITGVPLSKMKFMFCGAGSAGSGMGELLLIALQREGLSYDEAIKRIVYVNINGLISKSSAEIPDHVSKFASDLPEMDFCSAIRTIKPNALIGATGFGGLFSPDILQAMGSAQEQPIIFALSNPTDKAECTARDAYFYTQGRAIFASGSPFNVVHINGEIKVPGQGNNAYIFPGLGLGAVYGKLKRITNNELIVAAEQLAQAVSIKQLNQGCLYPPLGDIRNVSLKIATGVALSAEKDGNTYEPLVDNFEEYVKENMYDPVY